MSHSTKQYLKKSHITLRAGHTVGSEVMGTIYCMYLSKPRR